MEIFQSVISLYDASEPVVSALQNLSTVLGVRFCRREMCYCQSENMVNALLLTSKTTPLFPYKKGVLKCRLEAQEARTNWQPDAEYRRK